MEKSPDAFRTISEVSKWLDTPTHVLRFWESRFPQVAPVQRAGGRRYYRPDDVRLLGGIKDLLHVQGHSIRDVQDMLASDGVEAVAARSAPVDLAQPAAPAPRTPGRLNFIADPEPADAPADPAGPAEDPPGDFAEAYAELAALDGLGNLDPDADESGGDFAPEDDPAALDGLSAGAHAPAPTGDPAADAAAARAADGIPGPVQGGASATAGSDELPESGSGESWAAAPAEEADGMDGPIDPAPATASADPELPRPEAVAGGAQPPAAEGWPSFSDTPPSPMDAGSAPEDWSADPSSAEETAETPYGMDDAMLSQPAPDMEQPAVAEGWPAGFGSAAGAAPADAGMDVPGPEISADYGETGHDPVETELSAEAGTGEPDGGFASAEHPEAGTMDHDPQEPAFAAPGEFEPSEPASADSGASDGDADSVEEDVPAAADLEQTGAFTPWGRTPDSPAGQADTSALDESEASPAIAAPMADGTDPSAASFSSQDIADDDEAGDVGTAADVPAAPVPAAAEAADSTGMAPLDGPVRMETASDPSPPDAEDADSIGETDGSTADPFGETTPSAAEGPDVSGMAPLAEPADIEESAAPSTSSFAAPPLEDAPAPVSEAPFADPQEEDDPLAPAGTVATDALGAGDDESADAPFPAAAETAGPDGDPGPAMADGMDGAGDPEDISGAALLPADDDGAAGWPSAFGSDPDDGDASETADAMPEPLDGGDGPSESGDAWPSAFGDGAGPQAPGLPGQETGTEEPMADTGESAEEVPADPPPVFQRHWQRPPAPPPAAVPPAPAAELGGFRTRRDRPGQQDRPAIQGFFFNDLEQDVLPPPASALEKEELEPGQGYSALDALAGGKAPGTDEMDDAPTDALPAAAPAPQLQSVPRPVLPVDPPAAAPAWPALPTQAAELRALGRQAILDRLGRDEAARQLARLAALRDRLGAA
ncbi:MerR family transcriptional regulator [Poseidonocella sp. HB161398]|uniref:MerR family transcriptional regulator n=1 Tax=Poseidonocella sp. HB161398 TaxID=2320855 RepID=UPI001108DE2D|nr:MerR family transcriptional regulator [Poseidonocella sp. HB161398]